MDALQKKWSAEQRASNEAIPYRPVVLTQEQNMLTTGQKQSQTS